MKRYGLAGAAFMLATLLAYITPAVGKSLEITTPLPEPVEKTYRATFPKGEIKKLDASEENGVMVYDIEFKDGPIEKETDISADGTMLEFTIVIDAKEFPKAAMKTVKKAANGAKLGRLERIHLSYETEDAKVVKLPKTEIRYAAEMAKGDLKAEIITTPEGKVVEAPEWVDAK